MKYKNITPENLRKIYININKNLFKQLIRLLSVQEKIHLSEVLES
jgi:hypothetical protein